MKTYQDEPIIDSFKRHKQEREMGIKDNRSLEDKLKLIKNNFDVADKMYNKYSHTRFRLNNGGLFLGEVTKYKKDLKKLKSEMFDIFKTTWENLIKYKYDIPPETSKLYHKRYGAYNYDATRNTFKGTIFEDH